MQKALRLLDTRWVTTEVRNNFHADPADQPLPQARPSSRIRLRYKEDDASNTPDALYSLLSSPTHKLRAVLLLGEDGTRTELIATAIHNAREGATSPLLWVDCRTVVPAMIRDYDSAHPRDLSPLGSIESIEALFTECDGASIYFDEVGELPLPFQREMARLLISRRTATPLLGKEHKPRRILASTSRDLQQMIIDRSFDRSLFTLISDITLDVLPLRLRRDDLGALAARILSDQTHTSGLQHSFSHEAMAAIYSNDWPGNVQALERTIAHACAASSNSVIQIEDLPTDLQHASRSTTVPGSSPILSNEDQAMTGGASTPKEDTCGRPSAALAEPSSRSIRKALGTLRSKHNRWIEASSRPLRRWISAVWGHIR